MSLNERTLDWNLLRAFLTVVEAGSLTRAAERLATSQPTLSRQMATLEASVGVPLFERTARRLVPTSAGQSLIEPARRMRGAMQAAGTALEQDRQTLAGTVRLTASEVVSAYVLPAILAKLAQRHPEIEVELVASNLIDNLLEREADIAVRMLRPTQGAVITRHIADWPLGLFAHRDYLASVGGDIDPARLASYRWIGQDQDLQLIEGFLSAGFQVDRRFFGFRCDNQIVGVQAMRAGLGIGIAFVPLAERLGDLVRIWPSQRLPSLSVWLTAHREMRASLRLKTVFDLVAGELLLWGKARRAQRVRAR